MFLLVRGQTGHGVIEGFVSHLLQCTVNRGVNNDNAFTLLINTTLSSVEHNNVSALL